MYNSRGIDMIAKPVISPDFTIEDMKGVIGYGRYYF